MSQLTGLNYDNDFACLVIYHKNILHLKFSNNRYIWKIYKLFFSSVLNILSKIPKSVKFNVNYHQFLLPGAFIRGYTCLQYFYECVQKLQIQKKKKQLLHKSWQDSPPNETWKKYIYLNLMWNDFEFKFLMAIKTIISISQKNFTEWTLCFSFKIWCTRICYHLAVLTGV